MKKSDLEDGTLAKLFDYFAWAMNCLLEGKYPTHDWKGKRCKKAGQKIKTKGYNLALNQIRGDWEFYSNVMGLPRWDSEPGMCFVCGASNSIPDLLWTRGGLHAGWRPTLRTHESWVLECLAKGVLLCNFFKILSFRSEGVMIDILHAVDQGVAPHLVANVMMEVPSC